MLYYLDTVIVIDAVEGNPADQQRAFNQLAALEQAGHRFAINELTLIECLVPVLGPGDGQRLSDFFQFFNGPNLRTLGSTAATYARASAIWGGHTFRAIPPAQPKRYGLAHALHLATAIEFGCDVFLTNDYPRQGESMSEISRRIFLSAAATAASLTGSNTIADEEFAFKNNVPDPLLAGDELPTFKYELEKSEGKVIGGSFGKEATVKQLPISKGIAGVSMRLEPGAMRELHWHATAAEWAFVIEGRVRTTVIDPQGRAETNDFEPGDIWYFPRGHGHMLECLGNKPAHFILIFDNGYFSEFGTFSITDWIGHTSKHLLAKNFGLPESAFDGFPKDRGLLRSRASSHRDHPSRITRGRSRRRPILIAIRMLAQEPHSIHKGGREWRVGADRFPISKTITGVILDLEPGGLRELHWHPTSDEWQYVIEGQISVTLFGSHGRYRVETLNQGRCRLHSSRIRPFHRERRRQKLPRPDRIQHGPLRSDRSLDVDRGQSPRRARDELRQASSPVRNDFPATAIFIAPTETPRHGDRELALEPGSSSEPRSGG